MISKPPRCPYNASAAGPSSDSLYGLTSYAEALLLREVAGRSTLFQRMADCIPDPREPARVEHDQATTIRTKLLKIGAVVVVSVRRIVLRLSSGYPLKDLFERAVGRLMPRVRLE